jgi:Chlorophyll A-B binding protein
MSISPRYSILTASFLERHGRIAQLAIVGYIAVDQGLVLHPYGAGLTSATAHDVLVEKGVMGNMLVFIGLFEIVGWLAVAEMLQGSGREAGDFGFGTSFLNGKSEAQIKKLKYNEIKNGRLAMMAFGGAVTQSVLYDVGFPYTG